MQVVDDAIASMLRSAIRAPRVYLWMELPLITDATLMSVDYEKLGSQIILDKVLGVSTTQMYTPGSDSMDAKVSNQDGSLSPIGPNSSLGRYFYPGAIDNKIAVYFGLTNSGQEVIAPAGIYVTRSINQKSTGEANEMTITAADQFQMFQATVSASFPPRLYGNQISNYYNPNYALKNPSGDSMTYISDTKNWMTDTVSAPAFASDYSVLTVYVGTADAPASTPTKLQFTANYPLGTVTFASPLASGSIVSVDVTPLAMAPELMMYHLFTEFGYMDPSWFKFDMSGILLPRMDLGSDRSIMEIATDIATATAGRGIAWTLFFDELGYLNFREILQDAGAVAVLTDDRDILSWTPEYDATNIENVIRATATAINTQPITVVSYDGDSMNAYGQSATYDLSYDLLTAVKGMDPGSAVTFMSGLCNSQLFSNSTPTISAELEVLYNPLYQCGDILTIRESRTATDLDFYIDQNRKEITGADIKQTLRVVQFKKSQDYNFGLASYFGAPQPQTGQNGNQGLGGLIAQVSIAGTAVVTNGQPVKNTQGTPLVASWNGGGLTVDIETITPPNASSIALWRWIYIAEDAYVETSNGTILKAYGNGQSCGIYPNPEGPTPAQVSDLTGAYYEFFQDYAHTFGGFNPNNVATLPYDFRANLDSVGSRRFFWPLIRTADWIANDGVLSASVISSSSTWNGGPAGSTVIDPNGTPDGGASGFYQLYGNLRVGISDFFQTTTLAYSGVALYATGTPGALALGATSTANYGVDFGLPVNPNKLFYGINRKITPAYLCILAASTAGTYQFKRIPFQLAL
jgi:hypothetical protein